MNRIFLALLLLLASSGCAGKESEDRSGLLLLLGVGASTSPCAGQNSSGFVICVPAGVAQ